MDRKGSRKKAAAQPVAAIPQAAPPPPPAPPAPPVGAAPPAPLLPPARRPGLAPRLLGSAPVPPGDTAPIIESGPAEAVEHRHFPRARLATRFEVWIDDQGERRFTASLRSANVSVGGAFLESTFFLPLNTELRVRFALEQGAVPVEARARVVRELRGARGEEASGFGIRFEEFYGQTEVALARLFLDTRLRTFAQDYLRSQRARGLPNELERVVDALAAWELLKANQPRDTWRGE